jgi:uncharacterized membrane protein YqiK
MNPILLSALSVLGGGFVMVTGFAIMVKKFYIKVSPGQALINNKTGDLVTVSFTGGLVLPIIHRAEIMDLSVKMIEIERRGREGLTCMDNVRADIKVAFFVQVSHDAEKVKQVAGRIGTERASHVETLHTLFTAKFSEALKTVGYQMNFLQLYTDRANFRKQIHDQIGTDLDGYELTDVVIDYLEQTPIDSLDPENMLDSEGIRAITKITKEKEVETNRLRNEAQMQIKQQDTAAQEVITKQDTMQKSVIAAREREAVVAQARERAEAEIEVQKALLEANSAKIRTDEELAIAEQNKQRQIEVAQKNRERVVGVEAERVLKDRNLEAIIREREVDLSRIEKEKLVEIQKKEIADTVRGRIAVDRTVAEEEERIKTVRVVEEAKRNRDAALIAAETEAQQRLVKDIKGAEAQEKAATHLAKERLIMAEADLESADRESRAKVRRAEGIQAEAAAPGLAAVKVKEADASAFEKRGMIEAKVDRERLMAIADGERSKGLALVEVQEAESQAILKKGEAEATVIERKLVADAKGKEADAKAEEVRGMARARVQEAEAQAIEKRGLAESVAIREKGHAEADALQNKMSAEAKGLAEKMTAMKAMEGTAREHEEFRLQMENDRLIKMQGMEIQARIAAEQARVLGEAFKNAKIDIVGGDGAFFDRFVNAVTMGKSIDAVVDRSSTVQVVADEYLRQGRSLPEDLRTVLSNPAISADDLKNLSIAALLGKLAGKAEGDEKQKIMGLIEAAKKMGLQ